MDGVLLDRMDLPNMAFFCHGRANPSVVATTLKKIRVVLCFFVVKKCYVRAPG